MNKCTLCNPQARAVTKQNGTPAVDLATGETSDVSGANVNEEGYLDFRSLKGRERVKAMQQELQAGMMDLVASPDEYEAWLQERRLGKSYSARNRLLIALQKGFHAQNCHTYKQWEAMGYKVRKGARSAMVLRPIFKEVDEPTKDTKGKDDEEKCTILVGCSSYGVFAESDLDYTVKMPPKDPIVQHYLEHEHNPKVKDSERLRQDLTAVADQLGVKVVYSNPIKNGNLNSDTGGYTTKNRKGENVVVINSEFPEHTQTTTLAHEMGHIMCGHTDRLLTQGGLGSIRMSEVDHNQEEVEAESVAYHLTKQYGMEKGISSFAYLQSWSRDDPKRLERALGNVEKALCTYSGALEKHLTGSNEDERTDAARKAVKDNYDKRQAQKRKA